MRNGRTLRVKWSTTPAEHSAFNIQGEMGPGSGNTAIWEADLFAPAARDSQVCLKFPQHSNPLALHLSHIVQEAWLAIPVV